jgi:hypothetical protein
MMGDMKQHLGRMVCALLLSAAAHLSSGNALAQNPPLLTACPPGKVCYAFIVNPFVVCANNATPTNPVGCAPFNTLSRVGNPGAATSTTPIGFTYTDPTTGKTTDITKAILNQIGLDVVWLPIQQYNNTSFQSITVTQDANGNLTSPQFQTLSQQPGIANGAIKTPAFPLYRIPTVLNIAFVNTLIPPTPGTLYGFSWLGNNGTAISANAFFPPWPLTPRYDNLAHELMHVGGLNHTDPFNYNGTAPPFDVVTAGNTRTEPTSSLNVLAQLASGAGNGTADQLSTMNTPNYPGMSYQQNLISNSGFLNAIASSTTTATDPPNIPLIFFDTTGPVNGRPGETLIGLDLMLGPGADFDPPNKVNFLSGGNYVVKAKYDKGKSGDIDCPIAGANCLVISLTGLPAGQDLKFSQGFVKSKQGPKQAVTLDDLAAAGLTVIYKFSGGLVVPQTLTGSSAQGSLQGDSQQPTSFEIPAQIDPTVFTQAPNTSPCSPSNPTCSSSLVLLDVTDDKQPGAVASCTASGSLSALIQSPGPPATVTAYVANGSWSTSNKGIQIVPIEPPGGAAVSVMTANVVNSCASNSMTGKTVCTANNTDVYLLSGTSLTNTLNSNATNVGGFLGNCQNCGVAINQDTNTAAITMGVAGSPSGTGLRFLDLGTNAFSLPIAAAKKISEGVLWDPTVRPLQLSEGSILAQQGLLLSPNEDGIYDLFAPQSFNTASEYANLAGGSLDMAAEDCSTGIALATNEFTNKVFLADLTQGTFDPGAPGSWGTEQQFVSLPEFGSFSHGTSGLAVAPGSQLAIITGEVGGNQFGIIQLPDHSGIGTPTIVDYVAAALPSTPDTKPWNQGPDPHTVTAYVSPNNGNAYGLMANASNCSGSNCNGLPTYLAVIDLAALLSAPRVTGAHNVDPGYNLISNGVVRYVATH